MVDYVFDIPVVLFVFRRLDTVKLIMEKLEQIKPRVLYIFSDGPREGKEEEKKKVQQVREYIKDVVKWECNLHLEYAQYNKGCATNICDGIDKVFETEKSAIIFEDDAVPMIEFFEYCKVLLQKYEEDKRIQYIAGFNAVGDTECIKDSYCFSYTAPMSGAIATWADRWNECDFSIKSWPLRKKDRFLRKYYFTSEIYHQVSNALDDAFRNVGDGWDYQFQFDQLNKERFAIVPRGNLVQSYTFVEGAFHEMNAHQIEMFKIILKQTKQEFHFPMEEPEDMICNKEYDKLRQKYYLEVNGNYLVRHIYYFKRKIKDIIYQIMPKRLWNLLKKILKNS